MNRKAAATNRKIHVWIGTSEQNDEDWYRYFALEGQGSACGFCRDTQVQRFDFDFFSA